MRTLLIANRGEVAVRIARTAADLGLGTVAVHSQDDAASQHVRIADASVPLTGEGPAPYLDIAQLLEAARRTGCDAVHPGYGFLSESAAFAGACAEAGLTFVGPEPATLALFGDKARARALAREVGAPILAGSEGPTSLEAARRFLADLGPGGAVMVKAICGGGGRGMRPAASPEELEEAFERCASEARAAFGDGALYVEALLPRARHVEVQVVGDGAHVVHLWDRECSLQRQRQKLIEVAPVDGLAKPLRDQLLTTAVRLAEAVAYRGLGTIEFLVEGEGPGARFVFLEANPRLQVEHTVTEAVTGLDLVRLQLEIAAGRDLAELGLAQARVPKPRGHAVQARINLESLGEDGSARPAPEAILTAFDLPAGPGVRVDTFACAGYRTSSRFDSLLAKLVVHSPNGGRAAALAKAYRALCEFRIEGPPTNIGVLQSLLVHPDVVAGRVDTRFVERHIAELLAAGAAHPKRFPEPAAADGAANVGATRLKEGGPPVPDGLAAVRAPLNGTVVARPAEVGEIVRAGQALLVLEAMKMEHVVAAPQSGEVRALLVSVGETVAESQALAFLDPASGPGAALAMDEPAPETIRPDLAALLERRRLTSDEARPEAVSRRRKTGQRTARENLADLLDPGSFAEYGALTVAARRRRNTLDELVATTPADGLVMGLGAVNGELFPEEAARVAVLAYDYTVLAGTQGAHSMGKLNRMGELAIRFRLPVVLFAEGGGGRPGDTERVTTSRGWEYLARLSGAVPLVGVAAGRCFAGNAGLLGCCDVIIATRESTLGLAGPAMIEGGGLGVFRPEEIGPAEVMHANGVIDVLVEDEAEAVVAAKKYLSYFQGRVADWTCADQRRLRAAVPENRLRAYDVRRVIELLADTGSVLELRAGFGTAMVTAFIRVEGRPLGVIANNPLRLSGAIDAEASDKAARFMQVCEAFDIPILSLCDTPGNMVGPDAERTAQLRRCSRMFLIGANLTVPIFTVVLRKSYGLGSAAMAGGSWFTPMFLVSWPTGEFGHMGLEGSVKLGYRNELAAIADPVARKARFDEMVAAAYEESKALNHATGVDIDDVIDPAETRHWIMTGLRSLPPRPPLTEKKLRWIDGW